jgi:hypothetical protein
VNGQQHGDRPQHNSEQQAFPESSLSPTTTQDKVTGDTAEQGKPDKNTAHELAREFRWFEKLSLAINAILAVIAIGALIVYNGQLSVMRGQLEQMRGGSTQTDRMIEKADNIAGSIGHMVTDNKAALKENRDTIQKTLAENRDALSKALGQNDKAMAATIRQGRDALNASIEASRLDQRAWVGVGEMRVVNNMVSGEQLHITVTMKNTGKTPALNLRVSGRLKFRSRLSLPSDAAISGEQETTLAPGVGDWVWNLRWSKLLTEGDIASLNSGRFELTVYGAVTYRDIFPGTPGRETGFCGVYSAENRPALSSCPIEASSLSYMK